MACNKKYLEKKPDKALVVPTTLQDFQALMDHEQFMNVTPALPVISSDDFYIDDRGWNSFSSEIERNVYTWNVEKYGNELQIADWSYPHRQIFYANIVLEGIENVAVSDANRLDYNRIKGSAYFFRAFALYGLSQMFAPSYRNKSFSDFKGLPFKNTAVIDETPILLNTDQIYAQIIDDLLTAVDLLPIQVAPINRPRKAAALGMLARVYLSMGKYEEAGKYAEECLQFNNGLIDYNILDNQAARPFPFAFPNENKEIIFYASLLPYSFFNSPYVTVDSLTYDMYSSYDLRKTILFHDKGLGLNNFRGSYSGAIPIFSGLATDEILLIKAECDARNDQLDDALESLNTLLRNRIQNGNFIEEIRNIKELIIERILLERRKELVARGLRWSDLRRLNQYSAYKTILRRKIGDEEYILDTEDPRYTFPLPLSELVPNLQ